jgi:hypothetical protein
MATTPVTGKVYMFKNKKTGLYLTAMIATSKEDALTFATYPVNVDKTALLLNPCMVTNDTETRYTGFDSS